MSKFRKLLAEDFLSQIFDKLAKKIEDIGQDFSDPNVVSLLPEALDYYGTLNSVCSLNAEKFMLVLNDVEKSYYGASEHDVSAENLSFPRKVLHPMSFMTAHQSRVFFSRPQPNKFPAIWRLKSAQGSYKRFFGISGSIAVNEREITTHALSVKCPLEFLELFVVLEKYDLHSLSETKKKILHHILMGKSNKEIADEENLSVKAIEKNLSLIYRAAQVSGKKELVLKV